MIARFNPTIFRLRPLRSVAPQASGDRWGRFVSWWAFWPDLLVETGRLLSGGYGRGALDWFKRLLGLQIWFAGVQAMILALILGQGYLLIRSALRITRFGAEIALYNQWMGR